VYVVLDFPAYSAIASFIPPLTVTE